MAFEALNVESGEGARDRLAQHGIATVPAVCVGDRCVSGVTLEDVATLVGVAYTPRPMLPPEVLAQRMDRVLTVASALLGQVGPEGLEYRRPDRDRTLRDLGYHIFKLTHAFLEAYDGDRLTGSMLGGTAPESMQTGEDLVAYGHDVRREVGEWWERAGAHDPLDRVIETYHGARTLHEAMERETWHGAQHTRQLAMLLHELELAPVDTLSEADLDGLPLPQGIWD